MTQPNQSFRCPKTSVYKLICAGCPDDKLTFNCFKPPIALKAAVVMRSWQRSMASSSKEYMRVVSMFASPNLHDKISVHQLPTVQHIIFPYKKLRLQCVFLCRLLLSSAHAPVQVHYAHEKRNRMAG